jgi:hypothetical protein
MVVRGVAIFRVLQIACAILVAACWMMAPAFAVDCRALVAEDDAQIKAFSEATERGVAAIDGDNCNGEIQADRDKVEILTRRVSITQTLKSVCAGEVTPADAAKLTRLRGQIEKDIKDEEQDCPQATTKSCEDKFAGCQQNSASFQDRCLTKCAGGDSGCVDSCTDRGAGVSEICKSGLKDCVASRDAEEKLRHPPDEGTIGCFGGCPAGKACVAHRCQ